MDNQVLLKIEIIQSIVENVSDDLSGESETTKYNWMKENTPLLKHIDNDMIMNQQAREYQVTSLNIGKDHAYYLMDQQKRIDLQHGDILNLGDYKVRVSLISKQKRSEVDQLPGKSNSEPRRDFSMQFDHMVNAKSRKSLSKDMNIVDTVANSRIEKMHHLVPSKSSFTVPKYIKQQKKQQVSVKSKQCNEASQSIEAKEAMTIQVKQRHIDHMFEYYQSNKESKSD